MVNVIGLLYGGAMLVNFAWPRALTNPEPNQTVVGKVQLLNFHIGFLNKIPILWTVFVVIALIGIIYYAVGRIDARTSAGQRCQGHARREADGRRPGWSGLTGRAAAR